MKEPASNQSLDEGSFYRRESDRLYNLKILLLLDQMRTQKLIRSPRPLDKIRESVK